MKIIVIKHLLVAVARSLRLLGALVLLSHMMSQVMSHMMSHTTSHMMGHMMSHVGSDMMSHKSNPPPVNYDHKHTRNCSHKKKQEGLCVLSDYNWRLQLCSESPKNHGL